MVPPRDDHGSDSGADGTGGSTAADVSAHSAEGPIEDVTFGIEFLDLRVDVFLFTFGW